MIFSPRGKCAFFALKIISIFLILLLTFISWTSVQFIPNFVYAYHTKRKDGCLPSLDEWQYIRL